MWVEIITFVILNAVITTLVITLLLKPYASHSRQTPTSEFPDIDRAKRQAKTAMTTERMLAEERLQQLFKQAGRPS